MGKYKISFCIVCMNRLHQLKKTLQKNIDDNAGYDDLEIVVLDYNSQDGMEEWMKENMGELIAQGRVVYFRTNEPETFSHSHSKNTAFKLATGDIVCNVNADHYTGQHFAQYVNESFSEDNNIVLTPAHLFTTKKNSSFPPDVMGRVCVMKSNFLKVSGFDERMDKYGFEDHDFVNRLEFASLKRVLIENKDFLQFISHTNEERYSLNGISNAISSIYISHCTAASSKIIFLYHDYTFEAGTLIDNYALDSSDYRNAYTPSSHFYQFTRKEAQWSKGQWKQFGKDVLELQPVSGEGFQLKNNMQDEHHRLTDTSGGSVFSSITEFSVIDEILRFKFTYFNREIMEQNYLQKKIIVNDNGFGNATLFKNFDTSRIIHL